MDESQLVFRGLPLAAALLLAAAAAAALILLYRRELRLAPRRLGFLLLGLRVAVALALAVLLLDAAFKLPREKLVPAKLLLLIDGSQSMGLADASRPAWQLEAEARALGLAISEEVRRRLSAMTRLQLAEAMLKDGRPAGGRRLLAALEERYQVIPFFLKKGAQELPLEPDGSLKLPPADGKQTDLGDPIVDAAIRQSPDLFSVALLVSDGGHNSGKRPEEVLGALRMGGIPLFTLGAGAAEPPADVRIAALEAPQAAFQGEEVQIHLSIAASRLEALTLPVKVLQGEEAIQEASIDLPSSFKEEATASMTLSFTPKNKGRSKFTASFPSQSGETAAENNRRDFWLNVIEEKVKVLFLDGSPRWEFRYLREALKNDATLAAESFLVTRPPDRRLPPGFPRDRDGLFAFDVIVLGDVDREVFTREELAGLRDFAVTRGGSIVFIAGERAMPYAYASTPVEELFPVKLLSPRPARPGAPGGAEGWQIALTAAGERSAVLRLDPSRERNRELWSLFPKVSWICPHAGAGPGAEVWAYARNSAAAAAGSAGAEPAEAEKSGALLLSQNAGAGRAFFAATDETWRWRYRAGEEHFAKFWGQLVRWLAAGRLPPGDDQARLATDQPQYEIPEKVAIRALLLHAGELQWDGPDFRVDAEVTSLSGEVSGGASRRVRLEAVPKSGGIFRGSIGTGSESNGLEAGEYRARLLVPALPGYGAREDRAAARFAVSEPPSREAEARARGEALLARLAERAAPGGRYLPLERAPELLEALPEKSRRVKESRLYDQWALAWPILLILAALLAIEWVIRKRCDLI